MARGLVQTSQQRAFNRKGRHCFWVPQVTNIVTLCWKLISEFSTMDIVCFCQCKVCFQMQACQNVHSLPNRLWQNHHNWFDFFGGQTPCVTKQLQWHFHGMCLHFPDALHFLLASNNPSCLFAIKLKAMFIEEIVWLHWLAQKFSGQNISKCQRITHFLHVIQFLQFWTFPFHCVNFQFALTWHVKLHLSLWVTAVWDKFIVECKEKGLHAASQEDCIFVVVHVSVEQSVAQTVLVQSFHNHEKIKRLHFSLSSLFFMNVVACCGNIVRPKCWTSWWWRTILSPDVRLHHRSIHFHHHPQSFIINKTGTIISLLGCSFSLLLAVDLFPSSFPFPPHVDFSFFFFFSSFS